jgi:hypothetical protein
MAFTKRRHLDAVLAQADRLGVLHQEFDTDPTTGKMVVRTVQDIEPALKHVQEVQVHGGGKSKPGDLWHLAHIPQWLAHKWWKEEGINPYRREGQDRMVKKLDDIEFRGLRITGGRIT